MSVGVRPPFARPLVAGAGRPGPGTVHLVTRVLEALMAGIGPVPCHTPLVLSATDHCLLAVTEFVARCEDTTRRLRPSVSLALEPSLLLGRFTVEHRWPGPSYALVTPGGAGPAALRWATAAVDAGTVPAAVVCEVVHGRPAGEDSVMVVAALLAPGGTESAVHLVTTDMHPGDPDRLPGAFGSALLRAATGADRAEVRT
ncbi:hypothetical protein OHS70_04195 [Streptomyces sp. NBC_00390]|uniref:hypothetical protein n=1 Tax=Streptomyces sp. NBC_00390 TaxID=2975736 RepID=UPI002E22E394